MTVALGASAYSVAVFHLLTFGKALLFPQYRARSSGATTTRTSVGWGVPEYMVYLDPSLLGSLALFVSPPVRFPIQDRIIRGRP